LAGCVFFVADKEGGTALSSRLRGSKPAEMLTISANRGYPLLHTSKTNGRRWLCSG
jgi:hypothetical protein